MTNAKYRWVIVAAGGVLGCVAIGAMFSLLRGSDAALRRIARENFPLRIMGTIIGGTAMAGSLGMATGSVIGGLIFDRFGNYGRLYLGSCGVGIGAFLVALTFRPIPQPAIHPIAAPAG